MGVRMEVYVLGQVFVRVQHTGQEEDAKIVRQFSSLSLQSTIFMYRSFIHAYTAICNPSCINGDCTRPGNCSCHAGWRGSRCNEGKFLMTTSYTNNYYLSKLLHPIAICYPPSGCLNGGYCISPGHCSCASGWTGDRCDQGITSSRLHVYTFRSIKL